MKTMEDDTLKITQYTYMYDWQTQGLIYGNLVRCRAIFV